MEEVSGCPVCLETLQDGRLLPCLHSLCKLCIDKLHLETGHKGELQCPICRFVVHLPANGGEGFPRDLTRSARQSFQCEQCGHDGDGSSPEAWCPKCSLAFCMKHAFEHLNSGAGHTLGKLPDEVKEAGSFTSDRLCSEHNSPLRFFCPACNTPICGDCAAIGTHHGHKKICLVKDVAAELQDTVRTKAGRLREALLPQTEDMLSTTKDVITMIAESARKTREDIRAASKRAIDAIELIVHEKLTEVDDLEVKRMKDLNSHEEDLVRHTDTLKSVLAFTEKLWTKDASTADAFDLLSLVAKRVDMLDALPVTRTPVQEARLATLEGVSEDELIDRARKIVGNVRPYQSSRICVKGGIRKVCVRGETAKLVVSVNDDNDQPLGQTGDDVCSKWLSVPQNSGQGPSLFLTSNNNGTYNISFQPEKTGNYLLHVSINGVELEDGVVVICVNRVFFDSAECQTGNKVSSDKRSVKHTGPEGWASVLGSRGMRSGLHIWKVKQETKKKSRFGSILGVAEKSSITSLEDNYQHAYSWHGRTGDVCGFGKWTKSMRPWQHDDVLQLELDCDKHTLVIKNLSSGDMAKIESLPIVELFPYFALTHQQDSLILVD